MNLEVLKLLWSCWDARLGKQSRDWGDLAWGCCLSLPKGQQHQALSQFVVTFQLG